LCGYAAIKRIGVDVPIEQEALEMTAWIGWP
jgi:hypothetical protein